MVYAGFWKRLGAYFIDVIVLLPLMAFTLWGNEQSRLFGLYNLVPALIIGLWFSVYLVKRYGGTPGKLLMKIKITRLDGTAVGYRESILRYLVLFVLSLITSLLAVVGTLDMTDEQYFLMDYAARYEFIRQAVPGWYDLFHVLINVWVWGEFVVMLTNSKRRALHDYMAGTVVICR